MSLAGASMIAGAGMNLAKGLVGMVQTARANKNLKRLMANPVTYKRPDEYAQELGMRKEAAAQQEMPGQKYAEQNIGSAASQARTAAEQGAISSNVYQSQVGNIFDKQASALSDLSMQSAQWQQQQKEALMGTMQRGAQYSDTEWQENKLRPYEMALNFNESQKQSGAQNLWGGAEGMVSGLANFAGTKYYTDILKGLQQTGQTGQSTQGNTANTGNPSIPYGVPSSVMNTIKNATPYEKMLQQLYNQGYSNR
jgi:hypothetical protein